MNNTKQITNPTELTEFIELCRHMGFSNNESLSKLKWQWILENKGSWWATVLKDKTHSNIVALSGIHPFKNGYRALFRGVQTFQRNAGLNKYHMSSYPFAEHLPKQMEWAQSKSNDKDVPIYITTNVDNDASGKMLRINKLFHLLEKAGIVNYVNEEIVFNTKQTIWEVNKETYYEKCI